MQSKLATFTTLIAAATLAAATGPNAQCNTGSLLCCNSVQPASSPAASKLLDLLNIVLSDVNAAVGITCSPVQVIGVGGTAW